ARDIRRRFAQEEGPLVETSTGINIVAIQLAKELVPGKRMNIVAVDIGLKYLNSTLFFGTLFFFAHLYFHSSS
ncbi:hypothetical protein GGI35DRAFT_463538, partial [Trichoderma velutinum]